MRLRQIARAFAVTALTAMAVGVVPPIAAPVTAAEPVDCDAFPDDPSCEPLPPASDDLTVNVTMQHFGGDWTVPFDVTSFGTGSITATGETTGTEVLFGLSDAAEYTLAIDLSSTPFQMVSITCDISGSSTSSSYTFTHALGNDVTCDAVIIAPATFIDVVVESIAGVGTFDVLADGIVDSGITVSTTTSGIGHGVGFSLPVVPGYPYSLQEDFTDPWLVTIVCTDADGNEIPSDNLVAEPGQDLDCTITNSLAVRVIINKYYDGVDPAPQFTEMIGSWSESSFEVETELGYQTTVAHGTYTVSEFTDFFEMTAICDVLLDDDIISTTVDNGNGSITFTAPRGAIVECSFSNSPLAMVTIEKRLIGGESVDPFTFTSDLGSASVHGLDVDDESPIETDSLYVSPDSSTISEAGPGGWTLDAVECYDANTDFTIDVFVEGDEFTLDGIESGGEYYCTVYNVAAVSVDKTLNDVDFTADEGVYNTSWDITVSNPLDTTMFIELVDEYFFAVGAEAGPAEVVSVEGVALNPDFDGVTDTLMAPTFALPGGETYTFHVTLPATIDPDLDEEARLCQNTFTGDNVAFTNWVSISSDGELDADWACGDIPAPDITVEKDVEALVLNDDGSYSQEYILDVTNDGDGYGTFDLYDQPGFSDNTEILDITFVDPITDETVVVDYTGDPVAIVEDYPLGAHHGIEIPVTVRFTVSVFDNIEEPDLSTWQCGVDDNDLPVLGLGLYNEAYLYTTDLEPYVVSACVALPISNVMIDKNAVGHEYLAADEIAVDFDIVVTNVIDEAHPAPLTGLYVLQDFLFIGSGSTGITTLEIELLGVDGVDPDTEDTAYELAPEEGMAAYGVIQPGNTHTWHVRVSYQIDLEGFNGTCPTPTGPDGAYNLTDVEGGIGGLANGLFWADLIRASFTFNDGEVIGFPFFPFFGSTPDRVDGGRTERVVLVDDELGFPIPIGEEFGIGISLDCVEVSTISVDKTVVNDNGFDAEAGDFEFELLEDFDGDVERTINAGAPYAIVTDGYTLAEVEDDRYTPGNFECESLPLDGPADPGKPAPEELISEPGRIELEMKPSTAYDCSITNDDVAVDLEVSIDDGGATAIAGGAPITYTIDAGIDDGAVAPGDDVTVSATLEAGWSWVTGTVVGCTGATIAGNVLTCVVPAATMNEDGSVVFTAQARLAAAAASGTYTALASVTNEGDPEEASPACDDANSGCDDTEAARAASISATKVSDAVGGSVARGATLKYTLTVTNQGPSTLLPGTQVTDDLPAGLTFVSAAGAGWLCNSGDPLVCTNDTVVAPNTSLPPLVITTKVDNTASGTIVNIGVFTAIVDQDAVAEPTALLGQRRTEAVITTATATASAAASVTVKSGSGGRGLPATGVEGLAPTMWVSAMTLSLGALALVFARRRRPLRS